VTPKRPWITGSTINKPALPSIRTGRILSSECLSGRVQTLRGLRRIGPVKVVRSIDAERERQIDLLTDFDVLPHGVSPATAGSGGPPAASSGI